MHNYPDINDLGKTCEDLVYFKVTDYTRNYIMLHQNHFKYFKLLILFVDDGMAASCLNVQQMALVNVM